MLLTVISALGGMLVNVIPAFISYLIRRQQTVEVKAKLEHEYRLAELKIEGDVSVTDISTAAAERESIRSSDRSNYNTGFFGALRASVRPIITFTLFFMFVFMKGYAFWWAMNLGYDMFEAVRHVWDESTQAMFAAILGFWFGSRTVEKFTKNV